MLIDLSHPFGHGTVTYPGLPAPEVSDHLSREKSRSVYAAGTEFQIGRISMVANTGTYLDTPFHRFENGVDLAGFPLEKMADLEGIAVTLETLRQHEVRGCAVLIRTGWDRHWETPQYAIDSPFLARADAEWLVAQKAALVGIDSINIDDLKDKSRPAHTVLLAAGIPIVEHLAGLDRLPAGGFRFHAAPPMVRGMGTFPVRAYAVLK